MNKVSTCVVLKHLPTGLQVRCQKERSQALNRFLAKRMLVDKIEAIMTGQKTKARQEFEKIRRQKRRRSRRAKNQMLDEKKRRANKKSMRGRVSDY